MIGASIETTRELWASSLRERLGQGRCKYSPASAMASWPLRCALLALPVDEAAGEDHIDLFFREAVLGGNRAGAFERDVLATRERATQIAHLQNISLAQPVVVLGMDEHQRQHAVIDEVLPMDAGKPFCQHESQSQIPRRDRRMFA